MKATLLICLALLATDVFAISRAAANFLTYPQSPEALGRGGLYFDMMDSDPLSVFTHPGHWGLLAERHRALVSAYVDRTRWLPGTFPVSDLGYSSRAVFYGFDRKSLAKYFGWDEPVSLAVGYSEFFFDYGEGDRVDENGQVIGHYHSGDRSHGLTISAGVHHDTWKLGLGATHKYIRSDLSISTADGFASDFGGEFHWNLLRLCNRRMHSVDTRQVALSTLEFSAAYSMTNVGGGITYTDDPVQRDPLPRNGLLAFSLRAAIDGNLNNNSRIEWFAIGTGIQASDELIKSHSNGDYSYRNPLGGIKPLEQFLQGSSDPAVALQEGIEFTFAQLLSVRFGNARGGDYLPSNHTSGYGITPMPLVRTLWNSPLSHVELQYHYAQLEYSEPPDYWSGVDNDMSYHQVTLGWNY